MQPELLLLDQLLDNCIQLCFEHQRELLPFFASLEYQYELLAVFAGKIN